MAEWSEKQRTSCFFTGHRAIDDADRVAVKKGVAEAIDRKTADGIRDFVCGGALGFDTIAALAVLEKKKSNPTVRLILYLPCPEQHHGWSADDRSRYEDIKRRADEVVYTSEFYFKGCMQLRDRRMAETSAHCICYYTRGGTGTAYTVKYARELGVDIEEITIPKA